MLPVGSSLLHLLIIIREALEFSPATPARARGAGGVITPSANITAVAELIGTRAICSSLLLETSGLRVEACGASGVDALIKERVRSA